MVNNSFFEKMTNGSMFCDTLKVGSKYVSAFYVKDDNADIEEIERSGFDGKLKVMFLDNVTVCVVLLKVKGTSNTFYETFVNLYSEDNMEEISRMHKQDKLYFVFCGSSSKVKAVIELDNFLKKKMDSFKTFFRESCPWTLPDFIAAKNYITEKYTSSELWNLDEVADVY